MKRLVSFLLVITMIIGAFACASEQLAYAETDSNVIHGKCGDNIVWNINADTETLTISGKGKMIFDLVQNYGPWVPYREYFRYVVIEDGITNIAENAFDACAIKKLYVSASVEKIEYGALKDEDEIIAVGNVVEIEFSQNSKLRSFALGTNLKETTWYKNLPNGLVYIGKMLFTYKGTTPKNIEIKDGTYAINREAFVDQNVLENITIPDSVERIGKDAFKGTAWYDNQLDGIVYAGNVLYNVKNANYYTDTKIKAGTVSVAEYAFYNFKYQMKDYVIPASVKYIDDYAYAYVSYVSDLTFESGSVLKEICEGAFCSSVIMYNSNLQFPDSLEFIDDGAFYEYWCVIDDEVVIDFPAGFTRIGECVFEESHVNKYSVDDENLYFSVDEAGVLFNKDKTVLIVAPSCFTLNEYYVPETVTRIEISAFSSVSASSSKFRKVVLPDSITEIGAFAFYNSCILSINLPYGIKTIEPYTFASSWIGDPGLFYIPKSVEIIKTRAFANCTGIDEYVIPETTNYIASDAFYGRTVDTKFYCYENSTAQSYAEHTQIPCVIYDDPDTSVLDLLIEEYQSIDRSLYTEESLANLDFAFNEINLVTIYYTEEQVAEWEADLSLAFENLEPLPADRSKLEAAINKAESVNRSYYTQDSLQKLDDLLEKANGEFSILNQTQADELSYKINEAVLSLEYLPADYKKVEQAIAESEKLDRILYSHATLAVLDQSISNVDYTLNITQQNIVDGFAERINSAISSLAYAVVVLNNEPNGIVVSATAKEIYPETVLTVDVLDSTEIERIDFAFGGHIKSLNYYDINLLLNAEKVQPEGTVTVKIRVPEGADPKKCRVYHVSDDPVDPLVRFASTLDGNFVVFETDHFSEFAVVEVESYLSGVSVTKLPEKLDYSIGEEIDLSGMEVTSVMSDGKSQVITEYDISSVDTSSVGTKTVTVYYTQGDITKSASFEITVSADSVSASITSGGESVTEINKKVKWYRSYSKDAVTLACSINASGRYNVKWSSDNAKVTVDSNGKVSCKGFLFAQKATVTATVTDSAGNVIATDSVVIRFYKFSFQLSKIQALVNEVFDPRRFRSL